MAYNGPMSRSPMDGILNGIINISDNIEKVNQKRVLRERETEKEDRETKIQELKIRNMGLDREKESLALEGLKEDKKIMDVVRKRFLRDLDIEEKELSTKKDQLSTYGQGIQLGNQMYDFDMGKTMTKGSPVLSEVDKGEVFERDLSNLKTPLNPEGNISPDHLKFKYRSDPKKMEKIDEVGRSSLRAQMSGEQLKTQPLEQIKTKGFFSEKSNIDDNTAQVASEIKSYGDLINLLNNQGALEDQGVDIETITDHYEDELLELAQKGLIEEQKD